MAQDNNLVSYKELEESIARNPSQQILHYGLTLAELEEKSRVTKGDSSSELPLTCSHFARDFRSMASYYPIEEPITGVRDERQAIGKYKITIKTSYVLVLNLTTHHMNYQHFLYPKCYPKYVLDQVIKLDGVIMWPLTWLNMVILLIIEQKLIILMI